MQKVCGVRRGCFNRFFTDSIWIARRAKQDYDPQLFKSRTSSLETRVLYFDRDPAVEYAGHIPGVFANFTSSDQCPKAQGERASRISGTRTQDEYPGSGP